MHFVSVLADLGLELLLSFLLGYSDTLGGGTGQQLFSKQNKVKTNKQNTHTHTHKKHHKTQLPKTHRKE